MNTCKTGPGLRQGAAGPRDNRLRTESRDTYELRRDHPDYVAAMERNYGWNFGALLLDQSFFGLALTLLSYTTVLPYFVRQLSDRSVYVGLISAISSAGYFAAQLPGAYLAHGRARRKPVIVGIAILQRLGLVILACTIGLVNRLPATWVLVLFFVAMAIKSTAEGLIGPAYSDFISKSIPARRGVYYGVTSIAVGVFGLAGTHAIKVILASYSFPLNFGVLFLLGLGMALISLVAITAYREEVFPETPQRKSFAEFFREIPAVLRGESQFRRLVLVRALVRLGGVAMPFFTMYAIESFGLGSGAVGEFTLILTVATMAAAVVAGWCGDRMGYKAVLEAAALLGGLAPVLIMVFPDRIVSYVAFALMSLSASALAVAESNLTMELSPPKETARFVGIANTVLAPVVTIGPLVGGWLVDGVSYGALFVMAASLSLAALLLTRLILEDPRPAEAARPAAMVNEVC